MDKKNLRGWKSDTLPLPEPIEMEEEIDEELLIIKKKEVNE